MLSKSRKLFPMLDGPSIPWENAENIYFVYCELFGNAQTLERLAERGGFAYAELPLFVDELEKRRGRLQAGH